MNSREKVLAAIEHRNTGRIPYCISPHKSLAVHGKKLHDLFCRFPGDFNDASELKIPTKEELEKSRRIVDKWGCVWETADIMIAGAVVNQPLADWKDLDSYKMPEISIITQKDIDKAEETKEKYPVWANVDQFFQVMENLRGAEQLYMDFYLEPEKIQKLIDRMLNENHIPLLEEQLKLKPDIVGLGDDWGTQQSLIINPELWDQFFKPAYAKLAAIAKQAGAKVFFHTCGYTIQILEGLIDAGIDIVNPQIPIMDAVEYGNIAKDRITVMPDVDRQNILINGTPDDVREHIQDMYRKLGTRIGGLIGYAPLEHNMPFANMEMLLETIANYIPE
jgi:uroporphyrinogen decarboxylase